MPSIAAPSSASVTFPKGLYKIDEGAFYECPLTSVTFPEGLQIIGKASFNSCPLTSVTFPEGLQIIGGYAFYQCPLTSVTVLDPKTVIHPDSFSGCAALEALCAASGHKSVLSYIRFQPTVRLRIAVLLCLQRLRGEWGRMLLRRRSTSTAAT